MTEQQQDKHNMEAKREMESSIQAHAGFEHQMCPVVRVGHPAASVPLMETSITCPLIFHSHTGAAIPRCNRYTDTQASCVITRGTMSAQLPAPLHSSGFQLTWADPHANHTWLLSTSRMKRIMLLGWCSSQQEGCVPPPPPPSRTTADRDECCSHLSHPVWSARGQPGLRASEQPPTPPTSIWISVNRTMNYNNTEVCCVRFQKWSVLRQTGCLCQLNVSHTDTSPIFPITMLSLCSFFSGLIKLYLQFLYTCEHPSVLKLWWMKCEERRRYDNSII